MVLELSLLLLYEMMFKHYANLRNILHAIFHMKTVFVWLKISIPKLPVFKDCELGLSLLCFWIKFHYLQKQDYVAQTNYRFILTKHVLFSPSPKFSKIHAFPSHYLSQAYMLHCCLQHCLLLVISCLRIMLYSAYLTWWAFYRHMAEYFATQINLKVLVRATCYLASRHT